LFELHIFHKNYEKAASKPILLSTWCFCNRL